MREVVFIGRGDSVAEATNAWHVNLKGHLRNASDDDPIVKYVKCLIGGTPSGTEVPSVIKGFVKQQSKKRGKNIWQSLKRNSILLQ